MLFGYITDKKERIFYRDPDTRTVVFSFKSREGWQSWLQTFPDKRLLADLDFEVVEVPWYEDNWELAKICLPGVLVIYAIITYL